MTTGYHGKRAPKTSKTGVPIWADVSGLDRLSKDLRKAPKAVKREFRTKWRAAAQLVAEEAKNRASWSTRIPGSIKVRGTGARIKIVAGGDKAPNAAVLEGEGVEKMFKHPVFERKHGDVVGKNGRTYKEQIRYTTRSNRRAIAAGRESAAPWVSQPTRPYLAPALESKKEEVVVMMEEAVQTAVNKSLAELS